MTAPVRGRAKAGSHALPTDEYEALLAKQSGGCAICGATPKTRRLHTDRDHRTGAVRGLLCHRCNRTLAAWINSEWLVRAAIYLAPDRSYFGNRDLRSAVISLYEGIV